MKIEEDFVLQEVAGSYLVVPVGQASSKLNGIIKLNSTAAYLWKLLCNKNMVEDELVESISVDFGIDRMQAKEDVLSFIDVLVELGCIVKS